MKKVLNVAVIALMMTGAAAMACDSCGCTAKKAEKKTECSTCTKAKDAKTCTAAKTCAADCKKACCTKKAEAK